MFNFFKNKVPKKSIRMQDIDDYVGNAEIIDVRTSSEFKSRAIKTAINIPMNLILLNPEKYISKDKEYYVYCLSGARSKEVCQRLNEEGYNLIDVLGGIRVYSGDNFSH